MPNVIPPPAPLCQGNWVCVKKNSIGDCIKWECDMGGGGDPIPDSPLPPIPSPPSPPPPSPPPIIPSAPIPIASFTYQLFAGKVVMFTNKTLGYAYRYKWDFGDGAVSYSKDPIDIYGSSGTYMVTLTAYNSVGGSSSQSQNIVVTALTSVADFSYVVLGSKVFFTDTSPVYGITSWNWDFGDNTSHSIEQNPSHEYDFTGNYAVKLIINGTYSKTIIITIENGILLEWDDNSDNETGFKLEHSSDGLIWEQFATVSADVNSYLVSLAQDGIDPTVLNYFRVRAYNDIGDSDYTNIVEMQCSGE